MTHKIASSPKRCRANWLILNDKRFHPGGYAGCMLNALSKFYHLKRGSYGTPDRKEVHGIQGQVEPENQRAHVHAEKGAGNNGQGIRTGGPDSHDQEPDDLQKIEINLLMAFAHSLRP